MVIANRDAVVVGTKLVATYKKQQYICTVEAGDEGKLAFVYDGKSYTSPSAAGTAVIGTAANGWRFWSIEGGEPAGAAPTKTAAKPKTRAKAPRSGRPRTNSVVFERHKDQSGLEDGQVRYVCHACLKLFIASPSDFPFGAVDACPEGHRNDDPELSAPAAPEAAEPEAKVERRKVLHRNPNQRGVAEGQVRWYCADCKGSFMADGSEAPAACPKGHSTDVPAAVEA